MNTAVRAAVRIGVDKGHIMLGIRNGFEGFIAGDIYEMDWMSVNGWAPRGGAELGTNRKIPAGGDFYAIARNIEKFDIQGLLVIGGWAAYQSAHQMYTQRHLFPAFNIPIVCLPATIDNDLPGSELSIGADTALNSIVESVDKIKQSAVASRRCFVVEVMGDECGYLALMSGLATGAERVYLPEEGVTLNDLKKDLDKLLAGFRQGKRLGLMIRNERVNRFYTTDFMAALFEEEGKNLFDVRTAILGHLQQGGDPTPFDRIQAARLASKCIEYLIEEAENSVPGGHFIGLQAGKVVFTPLDDMPRMVDQEHKRPRVQWWMDLRQIARTLANPGPSSQVYEG
ncbi:MAG TPA: 6-phosphofructokinase, partial [Anaerolineales bacterium]|nr:6-phosphofructokinase [Anaerolineales bacterium]